MMKFRSFGRMPGASHQNCGALIFRRVIVATKALAHKPARACYHILGEGKPFEATRCFAPRTDDDPAGHAQ
jgi:hypothetical protein